MSLTDLTCLAFEKVLEKCVHSAVVLKVLLNTTKKKYKSSFGTNLEDAKYMTQTSFLILSKWENLVNVVALVLDIDLNNLSPKKAMHSTGKQLREYYALLTLKNSIQVFKHLGKRLSQLLPNGMEEFLWTRTVVLYTLLLIFKSLTWNKVILTLLFNLGKNVLTSKNSTQMKTIYQKLHHLNEYFNLYPFNNLFNRNSSDSDLTGNFGGTATTGEPAIISTVVDMSNTLLSSFIIFDNMQTKPQQQQSFFMNHLVPSANAYHNYWSSLLYSMIPSWTKYTFNTNNAKL